MISKILIANRGEIAIRIIRTCIDMGIKTVAVFSEADRMAPHVLKATEAYFIGESPSSESYLNVKKIIEILKKCGADAVHPGYGFLSENYEFASMVRKCGSIWIGPSNNSIKTMGDKMAARKLAEKVNAPIIPGTQKSITNYQTALDIAVKIGFPILIKAAGGGGGKGMRIVNNETELKKSIERAQSEAEKSFSDKRVYIEKFLEDPHHIEIQILADNYGNHISLGERECSIQRRYQKIIEETPSPFINKKIRKKLEKTAIDISKSCNYSGAGTIEFLIDKYQNYYFLEMNTRLQVEHPITEMVNNLDLVQLQILIASGERLPFVQSDIQPTGHSIECRIYAEDGLNNFTPSTGIIENVFLPQGLGIRFDEGFLPNQEITPYYDPLLGKLISWGKDRTIALSRMNRALKEFQINGIETNIEFCKLIINHRLFKKGIYCTDTLEKIKDDLEKKISKHQINLLTPAAIGMVTEYLNSNKYIKPKSENKSKESNWKSIGKRNNLR